MKLVTIAGTDRCDFAYYLGKILYEVSPKIVCIDNSYTHKLFDSVSGNGPDSGIFEVKRSDIIYLKDIAYSPEFFEAFDYVLIYQGKNIGAEELLLSDYSVIMPNYEPDSIEMVRSFSHMELPDTMEFIMTDRAGKMTEKSAAALIGIPYEKIVAVIDYDMADYGNYLSLIYNGRQKPVGLSQGYSEALAYVTAKLTDGNIKNAVKLLKKARD